MSDFNFDVDILRGKMSTELQNNEEQAMWVIGDIAHSCDADRFAEHANVIEGASPEGVAVWLRELADLLDPVL